LNTIPLGKDRKSSNKRGEEREWSNTVSNERGTKPVRRVKQAWRRASRRNGVRGSWGGQPQTSGMNRRGKEDLVIKTTLFSFFREVKEGKIG